MLDPATLAIVTGAASNVIAYLAQGHIDAVRTRISAIFRHGTAQQQSQALRALDEDSTMLLQGTVTQEEITARWTALMASFLDAHREVREDIEALASSTPSGAKTVNIGSQHNHGSGTFIGGDNHGGITFTNGQGN